jgi:hypothetical protein
MVAVKGPKEPNSDVFKPNRLGRRSNCWLSILLLLSSSSSLSLWSSDFLHSTRWLGSSFIALGHSGESSLDDELRNKHTCTSAFFFPDATKLGLVVHPQLCHPSYGEERIDEYQHDRCCPPIFMPTFCEQIPYLTSGGKSQRKRIHIGHKMSHEPKSARCTKRVQKKCLSSAFILRDQSTNPGKPNQRCMQWCCNKFAPAKKK